MKDLKKFESISNIQNTIISNNKQSIFFIVECGCKMTENFLCGNTQNDNSKSNIDAMNKRSVFVQLCNKHK